MGYTNRMIPDDPTMFPEPPTFMTWVQEVTYQSAPTLRGYLYMPAPSGEGKIRHFYDLHSARKSLGWIGSKSKYRDPSQTGKYLTNWSLYERVDGEWVLRYSGKAGEERDRNPLAKLRLKPGERVHVIDKAIEDKAIESLLGGAKSG